MAYRTCITMTSLTPLVFRYHLPLIIRFCLNHRKNLKIQKIFKIFLEPSTRVPKASHTTFYFLAILKFFWLLSAC
jgi:hypothetical protein